MDALVAEHPLQSTPGTVRDFGVSRPLGKRLVWDIGGHATLGQLNVAFGGLCWMFVSRFGENSLLLFFVNHKAAFQP